MKLFSILLLSILSYHCCTGYPAVEGDLSEDLRIENGTSVENWLDASNDSAFNDSSQNRHGFGKKVVNKVKGGIKTVKDKVKGGLNKVKDKIRDFKDRIGSKGGDGGYYRDNYGRYNRDYHRKGTNSGGTGHWDPETAKWVGIGLGVFLVLSLLAVMVYYKVKRDS